MLSSLHTLSTQAEEHFSNKSKCIKFLYYSSRFFLVFQVGRLIFQSLQNYSPILSGPYSRNLAPETFENDFDCIVSNGSKHSIYNALGALVDPGDEVI